MHCGARGAIRELSPQASGRGTTFYDGRGLRKAFKLACERPGINGLRPHDRRHEAASQLAARMETATLAKVLGWRTLQVAVRYYNPTDEELVHAMRRPAAGARAATGTSHSPVKAPRRIPRAG
ncbi:tyrosine-type recombinase/integrase [Burkholderia multivorans]|uniref:tyrosine-type recombinase/integrase n=1 Tax=Burkholderia multivorans TaxID=87883 RepID=UPI00158FAA19|nr:tyrosine-type recombinase/integrase [Burkholderia multivorans]MBH9663490.1 tyrosine-type recombinase/integrase [Burkholderia multivorans]MBU9239864.1 tyrosine-type recombinase/integrase [Burkholderia multivorans]MBU9650025.1 tyrosine-type recombinase/integrase [Burkholderia multivorans]MCO1344441.1 tyrosine-type recombinase/integrase [Burkholderia multivorans]MCO1441763.1 tyrosine-type recombinase/integrase [Burkholderia multivorans]